MPKVKTKRKCDCNNIYIGCSDKCPDCRAERKRQLDRERSKKRRAGLADWIDRRPSETKEEVLTKARKAQHNLSMTTLIEW